ncbi:MAG TPA: hypothetical protein VI876_07375, partial [Dehalococcoidia bacterium]|nr:hypothetical protein [Dehalococcoidia bacterium]
MRDNEVRAAIAAFLGAVAIMAAAIGAFLVFMGGSGDSELSAVSEHRGAPTRQEPQEDAAQLSERRDDLPPRQDSHSRGPVCADSNACRRPSPELRAAYTNPRACAGTGRRLCLVPIGDVPKDLVDHLVEYYQAEYGLSLHVVPAVELTPGSDPERPG